MRAATTSSANLDTVGLDIGDGLMTAARVSLQKDGGLCLTQAGWEEYDPGASDRQMAKAIRRLWRRHAFSNYTVSSCLRTPSLNLKHFRYPRLPSAELAAALRLEAEEALQIPQDKIALDWHSVETSAASQDPSAERAEGTEGILVAAPRSEVDRHVELLRLAGLYPAVLDVGTFALGNILAALHGLPQRGEALCVAHLGRRMADLAILYEGGFIYPRLVSSRSADWERDPAQIAGHIQDMLKYSQFKLRHDPVKRLLLSGAALKTSGLSEAIAQSTGLACEIWNPLQRMKLSFRAGRALAGERDTRGPALATCLGLALRSV